MNTRGSTVFNSNNNSINQRSDNDEQSQFVSMDPTTVCVLQYDPKGVYTPHIIYPSIIILNSPSTAYFVSPAVVNQHALTNQLNSLPNKN